MTDREAQLLRDIERYKSELGDALETISILKSRNPSLGVMRKGSAIKVTADEGYSRPGSTLLKLRDTGNGLIAKFPAHSACFQHNYICLKYDEAEYLRVALTAWESRQRDENP